MPPGAGSSHAFLAWLTAHRLSYSIGFGLPDDIADRLTLIPDKVWAPAYDADGQVRRGAWVAEATGLLHLKTWPAGMRVIIRKERPHPGAQLRLTDVDGHRLTAFATNAPQTGPGSQLANLELRHRRRARCEDRIRNARDAGLRNLPLHGFTANQIWCEIVALAADLLAWLQLLGCTDPADETAHPARRWEPKRFWLRLLSTAGRLAVSARQTVLHLAASGRWTGVVLAILTRFRVLPAPSG